MKFNLKQSPIDERDYTYKSVVGVIEDLPESYDRENECSPVRDQGDYGFCYAFAGEGLKEQQEWQEWPDIKPIFSPLFLAKHCKDIDGVPDEEGSYLRIVCKVLSDTGICLESNYPYDGYEGNLKFPEMSDEIYTEANKYKIKSYASCTSLEEIKSAIVNKGLVLAGIMVYLNFLTPENGFVAYPSGTYKGGHAIALVGYYNNLSHTYTDGTTRTGFLKCRNSWNKDWGINDYFYLPYDFYNGKPDYGYPYFMEAWSSIDIIENVPKTIKEYYRVQVGAFSIKNNCTKLQNELNLKGFATYMVQKDNLWKVQCGAFLVKPNAENMKQKLIDAGYSDAWLTYY
jgi:C1A family cysteine protease